MLNCFLSAVATCGLQSRVQCDRGGCVRVSEFMLCHPEHSPGRRSCITGRSVQNYRIEGLWRDLLVGCVSLFYDLFGTLEEEGILDTSNGLHMFSLHYVFLPRINHQLKVFQDSYSHHRLRTAYVHCGDEIPVDVLRKHVHRCLGMKYVNTLCTHTTNHALCATFTSIMTSACRLYIQPCIVSFN